MAISTLLNLTVPLANDTTSSTQGLLMPKLAYRFRVTLENFGITGNTTELTKQVMEAGRPNIQFDPIVLDVYNSKIQMAGKHTWQPVSLMLRDDINGNVQKSVGEQLQKQFDFFEQASAATGQDYKFTQRIEVLDGGNGANTPAVLETWELYGCYLTNVDYGSMNYSTQDPMTVSLTIQYDNAVQLNVGVGVPNNFQDRNTETGTGATGGASL
jgi:hypothetical protein|tara:strand:- start:1080 stop:1718 length:639 start_codon:yes stop_codon:yes gene_type:complete